MYLQQALSETFYNRSQIVTVYSDDLVKLCKNTGQQMNMQGISKNTDVLGSEIHRLNNLLKNPIIPDLPNQKAGGPAIYR